jgi:hypothetical protein
MLPVLYSFRRCPYAIRARKTLLYTEQQVKLREVFLKDKPPPATTGLLPQGRARPAATFLPEALNLADPIGA